MNNVKAMVSAVVVSIATTIAAIYIATAQFSGETVKYLRKN